jgi:radical SAM protein with 4Fe4S-binding SPASM domain
VVDCRKYERLQFGFCPLGGEGSYFTIDPQGYVRICNHSPTILGNILTDHFPDIYYHHPYVQEFRETWPEECQNCPPDLKTLCGGGCKAAAEQCRGGLQHVDPFVSLSLGQRIAVQ